MSSPDFYLVATEGLKFDVPRACYRRARLGGRREDDYLLVAVEPALSDPTLVLGEAAIHHVVLATRHSGQSLFPVSEWPIAVYVARLTTSVEERKTLRISDLEVIAWGELYDTEKAALVRLNGVPP